MMKQHLIESTLVHFALLGLFILFQFLKPEPNIIWLAGPGFDFGGGGGEPKGDGRIKKGTIPKEKRGQPVPQPSKVTVPKKAAPVQKATKAEEAWKIKDKTKVKPVKEKKSESRAVQTGEKTQKEQTNIVS